MTGLARIFGALLFVCGVVTGSVGFSLTPFWVAAALLVSGIVAVMAGIFLLVAKITASDPAQ